MDQKDINAQSEMDFRREVMTALQAIIIILAVLLNVVAYQTSFAREHPIQTGLVLWGGFIALEVWLSFRRDEAKRRMERYHAN